MLIANNMSTCLLVLMVAYMYININIYGSFDKETLIIYRMLSINQTVLSDTVYGFTATYS